MASNGLSGVILNFCSQINKLMGFEWRYSVNIGVNPEDTKVKSEGPENVLYALENLFPVTLWWLSEMMFPCPPPTPSIGQVDQ